jgi:YfiH family protein
MTKGPITVSGFARPHDGVTHFFGTRDAPSRLPVANEILVSVKQVHGTDVLVLDRPISHQDMFQGGWDALVTNQPDVLLTVKTADCVPVLVYDPARRIVAAIHAGWRGTVADIVPKTLSLLRDRFGSESRSLQLGIGPSAGVCCYEVDDPVLCRLRLADRDRSTIVRESGMGKAMLDLRGLIRLQAEAYGVPHDQVHTASYCTICNQDLFYSYRREGTARGTMVSGIMLTR